MRFHLLSPELLVLLMLKIIRINQLRPSDARMRHKNSPQLIQIMACRLFGAKPLPKSGASM